MRREFDFGGDCLVHCDAHWGNLIVTDRGTCLIDWEEAGWGSPWLDLATVEIHLPQSPERQQRLEALYQGYGETPEREALNRAMAVRLMWLLTKIPTRLDIPELRDPLGVFMRYRARFQKLLASSHA